ncbi:MAG: glycoside hydrolase family 172 protein [Pseudomonadales bacterium]
MSDFNGLGLHLGNLARLSGARTYSISPENFDGAPGGGGRAKEGTGAEAARDLGLGWKISPSVRIPAGGTFELAHIEGAGAIQQIWLTPTGNWRQQVLRAWWDDAEEPSILCPLADFFCMGWCEYDPLSSLAICVNPGSGFNSYWEMPFRKRARLTLENLSSEEVTLYYQINYTLTDVEADRGYFHAHFRRVNPLPYADVFTLLDVAGTGHYVGTYMAWGSNNRGWWGEGEAKFYIDDDADFPTICGTGTEDYFCGSYCFLAKDREQGYERFSTPYAGLHQVIKPTGRFGSQQRFGMYRWHIPDPIRFQERLKVTMQALGWRSGRRYLPLQDDIASVAYWYQQQPASALPDLPDADGLEVI